VSNPFAALGLPARSDLTDEQVRTAWRAIAAAAHPDRADGGDPPRYAAASAAYAVLRTAWGRSEVYADLISQAPPAGPPSARALRRPPRRRLLRSPALVPARIGRGRPLRLLLRVLVAALLGVVAVRSGAGSPAVAGVVAGLGVWLVVTMRGDLAPPPGR